MADNTISIGDIRLTGISDGSTTYPAPLNSIFPAVTAEQWALISTDPAVMHGQAVIAGTRVPVSVILDCLAAGMTAEDVVAEFPTVPAYREGWAESAVFLGGLQRDTGRAKDYEKTYREAMRVLEELIAEFPLVRAYRYHLVQDYGRFTLLLRATGRLDEAEKMARRMAELADGLIAESPAAPHYRYEWANSRSALADALARVLRPKEAEPAYREALDAYERLVSEFPKDEPYRVRLGGCSTRFGIFLANQPRERAEIGIRFGELC